MFVVNVGKYTIVIHSMVCYGYHHIPWSINFRITLTPQPILPRFSRCIPWHSQQNNTTWDSVKTAIFSAEIGTISASSRLSKSCLLFKSQELKVRLVMMQPEPVLIFVELLLQQKHKQKNPQGTRKHIPNRFRGVRKIIRLKSAGWWYVFSFPRRDSYI